MNHYYILYKITTVPAGGHSIKYAKKISFDKVVYTKNRSEAKCVGFLASIMYYILYGLSTGYYDQIHEPIDLNRNNTKYIAKKDYNKN